MGSSIYKMKANTNIVLRICRKVGSAAQRYAGKILLHGKRITIVSNNCIGGTLYHDYGLPFTAPLINTNISMEHFLRICENLKDYMEADLEEVLPDNSVQEYFSSTLGGGGTITFPVGKLTLQNGESVLVFFQHEHDFQQSKAAWERRRSRINYENIYYIVATKVDGAEQYCKRFADLQQIPPERKLLLIIDKPWEDPGLYIRNMNVPSGVHFLTWVPGKLRRYYQCFPYLRWFCNAATPYK